MDRGSPDRLHAPRCDIAFDGIRTGASESGGHRPGRAAWSQSGRDPTKATIAGCHVRVGGYELALVGRVG